MFPAQALFTRIIHMLPSEAMIMVWDEESFTPKSDGWFLNTIIKIFRLLLARTAEEGSRTLLHATVAGEESHGSYLSDCEIKE